MGGGYGRIPTIMLGPNVKAGVTLPQTYTLHNVLRTVEDVYGVSHSAMANNVRPMVGQMATAGIPGARAGSCARQGPTGGCAALGTGFGGRRADLITGDNHRRCAVVRASV